MMHGRGTFTAKSGQVTNGKWEKDKLMPDISEIVKLKENLSELE